MAERGGYSHKHYWEKKGLKAMGGEFVKKGAILTREDGKWKKGLNVAGSGTLYALCAGKVYFHKKRGRYHTKVTQTFINIEPLGSTVQKEGDAGIAKVVIESTKKESSLSKKRISKKKETIES
jgi:ribosomal protein L27